MLKLDCLTVKVYYMCVQLTSSLVCNVVLSGKVCFPPISFTFGERLLLQDPIEAQSLHQAMNLVQGSCNHSYTHLRFCQRHLWSRFFFFFFKGKTPQCFHRLGNRFSTRCSMCVFSLMHLPDVNYRFIFSKSFHRCLVFCRPYMNEYCTSWQHSFCASLLCSPLGVLSSHLLCYADIVYACKSLNLFTSWDPCTSLPVYLSLQQDF